MNESIIDMLGRKICLSNRTPCVAKPTVKIWPDSLGRRENTVIFWLGGGGFLINARGTILLFDPVLEMDREKMLAETGHRMLLEYPINTRQIPHVDMVFYTHPDLDHVGPVTSRILAESSVLRTAPARVADILREHGVREEDITVCRAGDSFQIADCKIFSIPADHPWQLINPKMYGKPLGREDACGYVVRTPDGTVLLPGDTRLLETHFDIADVDLVLLDTAKCAFHLNVEGAILLANAYEDSHLIPYHYGMFDEPTIPAQENGDPQDVLRHVRNAEKRTHILAPGEPFVLKKCCIHKNEEQGK